jgi:hypothetical protein
LSKWNEEYTGGCKITVYENNGKTNIGLPKQLAEELGIAWPLEKDLSDGNVVIFLFAFLATSSMSSTSCFKATAQSN